MSLNCSMENYATEVEEALKQLIRDLAVIPAPSHHEEKRAAYVKGWMERNGARNVSVDDALNVIWPMNVTEDNDLIVFMAHTDVVFPDTTPLPFREDGDQFYAPGIGDDTACLAVLLFAAKYFNDRNIVPKTGVLIVANTCEEGLGNLKGCRKIVDTYGSRIKTLITIDGVLNTLITKAVGSHRYRVTVRTEGGHSYNAFGNRNAILYLSSIVKSLYEIKIPVKAGTKTTYNVGSFAGGTSINTIAQEAHMLYEYRSDDKECLSAMKSLFENVIASYQAAGLDVEVEPLGERPCNGDLDEAALCALKCSICKAAMETTGLVLEESSGSTDANYPLSKGIPSVCIGGCNFSGAHTREEVLYADTLCSGLRYILNVMQNFFSELQYPRIFR